MQSYTHRILRLSELSLIYVILLMAVSQLQQNPGEIIQFLFVAFLVLAGLIGLHFCNKKLSSLTFFEQDAERQANFLDSIQPKWRGWAIIALAGMSLFFELTMIRWQSSLFPVFAYYKNFTLLACFLGLGAGYAAAERKHIPLLTVLPVTAILFLLLTALRYGSGSYYDIFFTVPMPEESSIGGISILAYSGIIKPLMALATIYMVISSVFLFTAFIFYPIGQACGRVMEKEARLKAYGFNLLGSVLGVVIMLVASYLWTPPAIWLAGVIAVILIFIQYDRVAMVVSVICSAVLMTVVLWPVQPYIQQIHSPYQLIERTAKPDGLMQILSAGKYYQKVYDLSFENKNRDSDPALRKVAAYYELPFKVVSSLQRVAIVGAGSGNDVAAALRFSAKQVDAIEIDPVIAYLGKYYHPEKPYSNPNANLIVNDARTFFRQAVPGYDLIVYGVLDSHTLLSHASNVRVDSFVYTKEGIEDSYRLLNDGGVISLSFALPVDALGYKIYQIFKDLPGASKPMAIRVGYDSDYTTTFLVKKGGTLSLPPKLLSETKFEDISNQYIPSRPEVDLPTDDWPFFYMAKRVYPTTYLVALCLILALSVSFIRTQVGFQKLQREYLPFFFLGAGFMLVETKAITELGLYFGNTWIVVGIVIIGLLAMAYLANRVVEAYKLPSVGYNFILLLSMLAIGYWVATHGKMDASTPAAYAIVVLLLISPMFFSGLVFSTLLNRSQTAISPAMSYNLLGALVGGLLEYNSMYFGFAFLYLLAAGLYVIAWLTTKKTVSLS